MKVALLGGPGSGKTDVGKRIVRALNREDHPFDWKLIDGYVDDLVRRTGREYGMAGGIPHNTQVIAERWSREAEALHKGFHTVTCGTIYESMLYNGLQYLTPPVTENELVQWMHEAQTSMQFFGLLDDLTFNYDLLFAVGEVNPHDHSWYAVINAKLSQVLEARFRYAVPLTGPPKKKAADALAAIRHVRDTLAVEAASDDQSAI